MASAGAETVFTIEDVGQHVAQDDCWIVINDKVSEAMGWVGFVIGGAAW